MLVKVQASRHGASGQRQVVVLLPGGVPSTWSCSSFQLDPIALFDPRVQELSDFPSSGQRFVPFIVKLVSIRLISTYSWSALVESFFNGYQVSPECL
ncbi:hypothetical protein WB44_05340 [Synechococcus sp. WH 8020]|uniref:hypothetical protein n=1 Tax=Synechococcus sp. Cu2B8-bc1011 TaxID=3093725 RepID=UPI0006527FD3|nr:hypothetical protein WB44_05340 [Synechococcus sp. WH 8020]